jgi:O-methyltransferase involved in polyketide biosynthesis
MQPQKINLTREKATLLITLYGKAGESQMPDSLLNDHFAADAVRRLDYDFTKLQIRRDDMIGLAMRAKVLDDWVLEFIAGNPDATVLHLGCGLDSRVYRVDPPRHIRWFDVDYPEVIELRRQLYPGRDGYTMIGASVTEPGLLETVPRDRPVLVIAEGLLPYLPREEVPLLFKRLTAHFPSGEIAFDGYSKLGLWIIQHNRMIKATGAELHWSLDDPHDLERQVPGLTLVTELATYNSAGIARLSWPARLTVRIFQSVPWLRKIGRLLRYRF